MGSINNDHIDTGFGQRSNAIRRFRASANGCTYQQAAIAIFGSHRIRAGFFDVLESYQTAQMKLVIDDQHFLDAVFAHFGFAGFKVGAFLDGNQPLAGGHDVRYAVAVVGLEAHITLGHNTYQGFAFYDGEARKPVLTRHRQQVIQLRLRANGDWIFYNHAFVLFNLTHFSGLLTHGHALMDNADAAFLSHRNC